PSPPAEKKPVKKAKTATVDRIPPSPPPEEKPVKKARIAIIDRIPPSASIDEVEFEESDFIEPIDQGYELAESVLVERKRIGEYFIAEGLLEASDVLRALDIQKESDPDRKLGDILVSMNLVSARQLHEALSLQVEDMRSNLDRSRGDGLGYVELGNLLLEVGDFYGAIDSYLRACTIYRANQREYMVFELLEGVLDICPESLSAAKEIVRIRKAMDVDGQARAFYRLAVAYLLNDSPHEALAALEKSVSVDSSFEMARTLMDGIRPGLADSEDYADIAMILADIDRKFDRNSAKALAGIIREFQEGIETAVPIDDFNTHYDLGIAYLEMGLYRESLSEFEQVLKSPDFRMKAREMLGRCCLRLERFDEAEDHFRKGLSTTAGDLKSSVGFHLAIADVYRATGRNSQADKELAAAAKLDPEMVKVQRSLV
ncbi:MAG: tetratricopeptide repeat protein, partial [Candidatus Aegiribacteria sp.]|nr:tetratricopeptide repeat protein [Candidatus Aegiribacteria sp.]